MGALVLLLGENSTIGTGTSLKDGVSTKQSNMIGKQLPVFSRISFNCIIFCIRNE